VDSHGRPAPAATAKKGEPYRLRFYELDAGKGRYLGQVPFAEATMAEANDSKSPWVFAVSGSNPATKQPMIFVGGIEAIHARIGDASTLVDRRSAHRRRTLFSVHLLESCATSL
jgi:hypothetical protein